MSTTASPLDPFGYDMKVGADLDPSGRSASGDELVADAVLHRFSCEWLYLIGDPNDRVDFGERVTDWVGEALTDAALAAKGPRLSIILQRDPRIVTANVVVTRAPTGIRLADQTMVALLIAVVITTSSGTTISRIVGVSGISVDFLATGAA